LADVAGYGGQRVKASDGGVGANGDVAARASGHGVAGGGCAGIVACASVGWRPYLVVGKQRVARARARAFVYVWHTLIIDAGVVEWQAARIGTCGRQVCDIPNVYGGNSMYGRHATANGDHVYASRSNPD
jgi:hypothetical protein